MLRLIWIASIHTRLFLRTWMPSNIVLDWLRTRRGLKYGVPAMLLAVPYFAIANWCTIAIDNGAPGGLHLVVLITIWSGLKFIVMGPISVILLIKARVAEYGQARRARRQAVRTGQPGSAPTGHEALPHDQHGPTHLRRSSGALRA